jgi:hypothetical protein
MTAGAERAYGTMGVAAMLGMGVIAGAFWGDMLWWVEGERGVQESKVEVNEWVIWVMICFWKGKNASWLLRVAS